MKLLLISPDLQDSHLKFSRKEVKSFWFPMLSLATLAALTPTDVEVTIIDESIQKIDFEANVDLVGISAMTFLAPRAYEIADKFRRRGVKVVLGGIHSSALPHEAIKHADSVVIGEAEDLWGNLIQDFNNGNLKRFYKANHRPTLENLPHPRIDLLKKDAYMTANCVQASRGCPHGCDFCAVTDFFGNVYRLRPVRDVIEEVERLEGKFVAFVDDNITGNKKYARELFQALKPLKKKWGSQCSLSLAHSPELLKLAAESGCVSMFVGIETLSQDNLSGVNKSFNQVKHYEDHIKIFHDHGIMINAGMIFGLDGDNESVFETTVKFLEKNKIELVLFNILTPFPGTRLYQRLEDEGRIFDRNWSHYDGRHVVFKPKLMTEETLQEGFYWAFHRYFSIPSITKRILHPQQRLLGRLALNWGYRRMVLRIPEGSLTAFSKVLRKIQGTIPATIPKLDYEMLIPNTIESIKNKTQELSEQIDLFLKINVRKNEKIQTLLVDLEGVLGKINAKELKKRIKLAIKKTKMNITINCQNVRYVTPYALQLLFSQKEKLFQKYDIKIKLINLNSNIKEIIQELIEGKEYFEIDGLDI